jgi:uncharacterized membrane protein YdjX (TVP38/TMEM64 family)
MRVSITSSCDCSASNYLLGMTPLELPAFMTGTVAGMTVWGIVYASLGGASRSLLKSGVDLEELIGGEIAITKYMMYSYQIPGHA